MSAFRESLESIANFETSQLSKAELLQVQAILADKLSQVNFQLRTLSICNHRHPKKTED